MATTTRATGTARKRNALPGGRPTLADGTTPVLTREGREMMRARAARLRNVVLPELVRSFQQAADEDGRPAHEYEIALSELERLESILATAGPVEDVVARRRRPTVGLGDEVEVRFPDGASEVLLIVHPVEAPLDDRRISAESPLASALLGRRPGDVVEVNARDFSYRCRIVAWQGRGRSRRLITEALLPTKEEPVSA